eukprot:94136_1
MDFEEQINSIQVLNFSTDNSTIEPEQLITKKIYDCESYIVSDADEELIILIQFRQIVALHSITLFALSNTQTDDELDISAPKKVHIYKIDNLNKDFDDITTMKPDVNIKCSSKKLSKGQTVNLKQVSKNALKFNKIRYLAIYIETNQNDTENTFINGFRFNGKIDANQQNQLTDYNIHPFDIKKEITEAIINESEQKNEIITQHDLFECKPLKQLKNVMARHCNDNN